MATITSGEANTLVEVPLDVYGEQFKFIEWVRDVAASIDSGTPEAMVSEQVELLLSGIGGDLLKLHDLVQVVHAKLETELNWARTVGVAFCRALFENIDPTLELEVYGDNNPSGAEVAAKYILDAVGALVARPDWGPKPVPVLEFIVSLFKGDHSATTENLACGMLEKMAQSYYIFFYDNWDVFGTFALDVAHIIDRADGNGKSTRIDDILEIVQNQDCERDKLQNFRIECLYDVLGRIGLHDGHAARNNDRIQNDRVSSALIPVKELEKEAAKSLELFVSNPEWKCPAVSRLIKSVSQAVKINAPMSVRTAAFGIIDAMVRSEYLFFDKNLAILIHFVFSVAPSLDGMADTDQCNRLTELLDALSSHACERTLEQTCDIDGLRRSLGRAYEDVEVHLPGGGVRDDERA